MLPAATSSTKTLFTITRKIEQLPSYPMLCKLAAQNAVKITGDERAGSFSSGGVAGNYEFGADCLHGNLAGHGVTGEFRFEISKVGNVNFFGRSAWRLIFLAGLS